MGYLTIVIQTNSNSVTQLNQLQYGSTERSQEVNQLIDYLSKLAGANEVTGTFYVVTRNTDPTVATDGGASTLITYNP
jgi:hypothetical protein